jgi:hypothetical protein
MWRWHSNHMRVGCHGIRLGLQKFSLSPESPMLRTRLVLPAICLLAYSCASGAHELATDPRLVTDSSLPLARPSGIASGATISGDRRSLAQKAKWARRAGVGRRRDPHQRRQHIRSKINPYRRKRGCLRMRRHLLSQGLQKQLRSLRCHHFHCAHPASAGPTLLRSHERQRCVRANGLRRALFTHTPPRCRPHLPKALSKKQGRAETRI